jgi:hypothetical protein
MLACPHRDNQLVRAVDLTSSDYTVWTIAGTPGKQGFRDGEAYSLALLTDRPHNLKVYV